MLGRIQELEGSKMVSIAGAIAMSHASSPPHSLSELFLGSVQCRCLLNQIASPVHFYRCPGWRQGSVGGAAYTVSCLLPFPPSSYATGRISSETLESCCLMPKSQAHTHLKSFKNPPRAPEKCLHKSTNTNKRNPNEYTFKMLVTAWGKSFHPVVLTRRILSIFKYLSGG